MKYRITKAEHEEMSAEIREFYRADGEGFLLVVEGLDEPKAEPVKTPSEDVSGLKSALEKKKREADELKEKLRTYEDAQKTETERLKDAAERAEQEKNEALAKLAEAEKAAKAREVEAIRLKVAAEKGLKIDLADRLRGETEDEIRADAETLSAFFVPAGQGEPSREGNNPPHAKPPVGAPAQPPAAPSTPAEKTDLDRMKEGAERAKREAEAAKQRSEPSTVI